MEFLALILEKCNIFNNPCFLQFRYYYAQVRHDLYEGILLKDIAKANIKDLNAKTPKWYVPLINNSSNDPDAHAARQRRVKLLTTIGEIS